MEKYLSDLNNKKIIFNGVEFTNLAECCKALGVNHYSVYQRKRKTNCSYTEAIQYYIDNKTNRKSITSTKSNTRKGKKIIIDNVEYDSIRDCCESLGLNAQTVMTYASRTKCSMEEAVRHCLDAKFVFNNIVYNSFKECCEKVGVQYGSAQQRALQTKCTKQEAIQYYLDKKFIFNSITYNSFSDCCVKLGLKTDTVRCRAKDYNCTKQEAIQFYLDKRSN